MKNQKQETEYTREDHARSSDEVPFFPFRPVSVAHLEMDEVEQGQYEFMQRAGQPDNTTD